MRLHVVAPFNVPPRASSSWFPHATKVLMLPRMLRPLGWHVTEYAPEGSESAADEKVALVAGRDGSTGEMPVFGSDLHAAFGRRLSEELRRRSRPGDVVAHMLGAAHRDLVGELPDRVHVEPGVGYSDHPFGAIRIFESRAWRAYMLGAADARRQRRESIADPSATWVVPMAFDPEDWPAGGGSGDARGPYLVHLGRLHPGKGPGALAVLLGLMASSWPGAPRLVVAGTGDWAGWAAALPEASRRLVEVRGPTMGRARAALLGAAVAGIYPSVIQEPFGAAAVEGMFCGTPAIVSAWGALEENVIHGHTGYHCREPEEMLAAASACVEGRLRREHVMRWARARFSLEECGPLLDRALRGAAALWPRRAAEVGEAEAA